MATRPAHVYYITIFSGVRADHNIFLAHSAPTAVFFPARVPTFLIFWARKRADPNIFFGATR